MPIPVPSAFDVEAEPLVELALNAEWYSVLQGVLENALDPALWDGDETDYSNIEQAIIWIMALPITGEETVQIATGTYTGNGSSTQAITGLGFQPKLLIIYTSNYGSNNLLGIRIAGAKTAAIRQSPELEYNHNAVQSLDADGFTVTNQDGGLNNSFNENTRTFYYAALG